MPFFGCLLARTFTNIGQGHGPWQGPSLARDVKESSAGNGTSQIKRSYFFGTVEVIFFRRSSVPDERREDRLGALGVAGPALWSGGRELRRILDRQPSRLWIKPGQEWQC